MTTLSEAADRLRGAIPANHHGSTSVDSLDLQVVLEHVNATSSTSNDSSDRLDALTLAVQHFAGRGGVPDELILCAKAFADYLNGAS